MPLRRQTENTPGRPQCKPGRLMNHAASDSSRPVAANIVSPRRITDDCTARISDLFSSWPTATFDRYYSAMWPFTLGMRTYTFLYAGSMIVMLAVALWLCWREAKTQRQRTWVWAGMSLGLAYALAMVVGAKFLYDLIRGDVV